MKGVSGTWKDLTDNVNSLVGNLTAQVRNIAKVTTSVARGDLSEKITVEVKGKFLNSKVPLTLWWISLIHSLVKYPGWLKKWVPKENSVVKPMSKGRQDLEGSHRQRQSTRRNLTNQVRNITKVTTAVATGDLSQKITVEAKGEILELKNTINAMVDRLNSFAAEVTRVAKEVGTEGKLGAQAEVKGVAGTWKDLTDNVNQLAGNLTNQVRNIALVTTSVANGDLSKQITVEAKKAKF